MLSGMSDQGISSCLRPDWVMLGSPAEQPDGSQGVVLVASTQLNSAELSMELIATAGDLLGQWPLPKYMVSADMREYVLIFAKDYGEAMRYLFEQWQPPETRRAAIGGSRKALDR